MNKSITLLIILLICFFLLSISLTGCLEEKESDETTEKLLLEEMQLDIASVLPDWRDGDYHDYLATAQMLNDFNEQYPNLVYLFTIGKSILVRDIWCIRVTNENSYSNKYTCLIDGTMHGYEWEGGEACLYLAEYLLINFGKNNTISNILNSTEVYIIPMLNPDGREQDWRFNDNGVDLNRNFDVYFGKLKGRCLRLGKLFGRIRIGVIKIPRNDPFKWYWNCGRYAFSEPETKALKSLMEQLNYNDFSFYVNCHTALHVVVTPWISYKPPFEMTNKEKNLYRDVVNWVVENTEYEAFISEGFETGGNAMDWCFKEFRVPSFNYEIYTEKYDPCLGSGEHVNLVHWMKTALPFFMYLLVNIENLNNWETLDIQPSLPEGVPPIPLS
jgi:hypothetical protein